MSKKLPDENDPQWNLAVMIFREGSWGVFHPEKTERAVIDFFDKVIAICAAESDFNPRAVNGNAKGLFQIMTTVHADKIGGRDIFDPLVNINVAAKVSKESFDNGRDQFTPWEVYPDNPRYQAARGWGEPVYRKMALLEEQALGEAYAKALAGLVPGGSAIANVAEVATGDWADRIIGFIRSGALVVGAYLLGVVLLIVGLWMLFGRKIPKPPITKVLS